MMTAGDMGGGRGASGLEALRRLAVGWTLAPSTTTVEAIERLGFVQADPIRSPAAAQDLILRHRVPGYRVGDLGRAYAEGEIEEGMLYAYGFLPRRTWELLRPPQPPLSDLERDVLEAVRQADDVHPRDLEPQFGARRAVNAWGGQSRVTKLALERLQRFDFLRVCGREGGVRRYAIAAPPSLELPAADRLREAIVALVGVLAPCLDRTALSVAARLRRRLDAPVDHRAVVDALLASGELARADLDGRTYLWPADRPAPPEPGDGAPQARLLAPFDPLVWDRARFEHLWGWAYRFEAYVPAAKRVRGYYAMPLLFGDRVIGWANARREGARVTLEVGLEGPAPSGLDEALEAERRRLEAALAV